MQDVQRFFDCGNQTKTSTPQMGSTHGDSATKLGIKTDADRCEIVISN